MKRHRFFISEQIYAREMSIQDNGICHQINNVLKLRPGEEIVVCDGAGVEGDAVITDVAPAEVKIVVRDCRAGKSEPTRAVELFCAVLKKENFEWVTQKATEVGVTAIIPIITEHTVKLGLRIDRLDIIAREAAEQSGRARVPTVAEPIKFSEALKRSNQFAANLWFDFGGQEISSYTPIGNSVSVWIGPEGGWSDSERGEAAKKNFSIVSLGPLALRGETAAVVASYLALHF